jgi:hypothetical protein
MRPLQEQAGPMLTMLRIFLVSGAAALGMVSVAIADMSGLIGNTIVEHDRQNPEVVVKTQLYADGSYQTWVSGGATSKGTWKERDGKLCYTQTSTPLPGYPTYFCAKGMDGRKVGDIWIERGWADGRWYQGRVVAGSN